MPGRHMGAHHPEAAAGVFDKPALDGIGHRPRAADTLDGGVPLVTTGLRLAGRGLLLPLRRPNLIAVLAAALVGLGTY